MYMFMHFSTCACICTCACVRFVWEARGGEKVMMMLAYLYIPMHRYLAAFIFLSSFQIDKGTVLGKMFTGDELFSLYWWNFLKAHFLEVSSQNDKLINDIYIIFSAFYWQYLIKIELQGFFFGLQKNERANYAAFCCRFDTFYVLVFPLLQFLGILDWDYLRGRLEYQCLSLWLWIIHILKAFGINIEEMFECQFAVIISSRIHFSKKNELIIMPYNIIFEDAIISAVIKQEEASQSIKI